MQINLQILQILFQNNYIIACQKNKVTHGLQNSVKLTAQHGNSSPLY
jgi:hypothetical protein